MFIREKEIVNFSKFQHDIRTIFRESPVEITSPFIKELKVQVEPNNSSLLVKELMNIAKMFPHQKCVLTYKINNTSNIIVEIYPVTDSA